MKGKQRLNEGKCFYVEGQVLGEWFKYLGEHKTLKFENDCKTAMSDFARFLIESKEMTEPITGESILSDYDTKGVRRWNALISSYLSELKTKKGLSHNSAVTRTTRIRSFFKKQERPLKPDSAIFQREEVPKRFHDFEHFELSRMWKLGTIQEKALLSFMSNSGLRISDALTVTKKTIQTAYQDALAKAKEEGRNEPELMSFQMTTKKKKTLGNPFITFECYTTLVDFWDSNPKFKDNDFIFPSEQGKSWTEPWANKVLENSWKRAYPERKDLDVTVHSLRSYCITQLIDQGSSEIQTKRLVGKKVPSDMSVYLTKMQLETAYRKALSKFVFGNGNGQVKTKLSDLENALKSVEGENAILKTRIDELQRGQMSLNAKMNENVEATKRAITKITEAQEIYQKAKTQFEELIKDLEKRVK